MAGPGEANKLGFQLGDFRAHDVMAAAKHLHNCFLNPVLDSPKLRLKIDEREHRLYALAAVAEAPVKDKMCVKETLIQISSVGAAASRGLRAVAAISR